MAFQMNHVSGESEPMWTAAGHHLSLIASVGIRNQGTLAGNLMMKHAHQDFPSDVFLTMETMGALLDIVQPDGKVETYTVAEFLAVVSAASMFLVARPRSHVSVPLVSKRSCLRLLISAPTSL